MGKKANLFVGKKEKEAMNKAETLEEKTLRRLFENKELITNGEFQILKNISEKLIARRKYNETEYNTKEEIVAYNKKVEIEKKESAMILKREFGEYAEKKGLEDAIMDVEDWIQIIQNDVDEAMEKIESYKKLEEIFEKEKTNK